MASTEGEVCSVYSPPARSGRPPLRRVHFLSPQNQAWVASYLAHLRARHYAVATQAHVLRALKCFAVLMPAGRQTTLYQDLTQTTPADIDAWIAAAFQQGLAPGTIVTYRQGLGLLWLPVSPRGPGAVAHSAPTPSHSRAHAAPPADGGSRDRRVLSGDRCAGRPHDVSVDAALWAPRKRSEPCTLGGDRYGPGDPAREHQ